MHLFTLFFISCKKKQHKKGSIKFDFAVSLAPPSAALHYVGSRWLKINGSELSESNCLKWNKNKIEVKYE